MEPKTFFAPALRSGNEEILQENELIVSQKFFKEIFGSMSGIGAVIDKNRQIVYANDDFLALLVSDTMEPVLGKRPGEVLSCIHSQEEESGCGTSAACMYCGAVNAIVDSQKSGLRTVREARISAVVDGKNKSWDLNITSTPITLSGNIFYVLTLQDTSDEKRRLALERIFFHDLMNTAGGLNGLLTILKDGTSPDSVRELIELSEEASRDIIEEISMHRHIRAAEIGDLKVKIEPVNSIELLDAAIGKISSHEVGVGKHIVKADHPVNTDLETDRLLFQRVLINLLKNALEATQIEGTVFTGVKSEGDKVIFWVKNDTVIPKDVQMQLFQRSFSTKGQSRGIGTYSIKLLTENYLNGKVRFISNESEGTVFSIELKKKFPAGNNNT
jgi:K+-sensing histidine kinase KdpD